MTDNENQRVKRIAESIKSLQAEWDEKCRETDTLIKDLMDFSEEVDRRCMELATINARLETENAELRARLEALE